MGGGGGGGVEGRAVGFGLLGLGRFWVFWRVWIWRFWGLGPPKLRRRPLGRKGNGCFEIF